MKHLLGRFSQSVLVVFVAASITFFLIQLAPGDPFTPPLDSTRVSREAAEQMRRNYGLDRPVHVQYFKYLGNVARGEFGVSYSERRPVRDVIADRLPYTILLALAAILIDFGLGVSLGVWQAARKGSLGDRTTSVISLAVHSAPVFWVGLIFIFVFSLQLDWLPVAGVSTVGASLTPVGNLLDVLKHLILPAATLGLVGAGGTARYQRAALIETLSLDLIRTARAKGIPEHLVILRHGLRNSLLTIVTLAGLSLPLLLSGAVLVEHVFSWPGMGRLAFDSILSRDYPVVIGTTVVASIFVVIGSFVADTVYRIVDPRTRPAA